MRYSIKKALRDLGVTLVGTVLLFVSTNIIEVAPDLGIEQGAAALIAVVSLAAYREIREQSDDLLDIDRPGA